jgi:cupin 2 domain-containing protein
VVRGRLSTDWPECGEDVHVLLDAGGVVVEEILSGTLDGPVEYLQDEHEWVALLAGGARLEVEGETLELAAGDWLYLPAGEPHTLLDTEPGSRWLAVRIRPG